MTINKVLLLIHLFSGEKKMQKRQRKEMRDRNILSLICFNSKMFELSISITSPVSHDLIFFTLIPYASAKWLWPVGRRSSTSPCSPTTTRTQSRAATYCLPIFPFCSGSSNAPNNLLLAGLFSLRTSKPISWCLPPFYPSFGWQFQFSLLYHSCFIFLLPRVWLDVAATFTILFLLTGNHILLLAPLLGSLISILCIFLLILCE